jgi:CRISPR/Cas system CSM-associated protein Csm5 (group 7 of RAMP superfamily)
VWKKGNKANTTLLEEADSLYWEMIRPDTEFATEVLIDSALYSTMAQCIPNFEKAAFEINKESILRCLNSFGRKVAEQELLYATTYKIPYLQAFYQNLQKQCEEAAQEGKKAYIPVGSGIAWHGKTIGNLLDSSSLDTIRRHFYRYMGKFVHLPCKASFHGMRLRRGLCPKCGKQIRPEKLSCIDPFPKTRHVVFSAGQPALPPGWVCVEIE